jgi:hypothetical protein
LWRGCENAPLEPLPGTGSPTPGPAIFAARICVVTRHIRDARSSARPSSRAVGGPLLYATPCRRRWHCTSTHASVSGRPLFAGWAAGEFGADVEVPEVAGVLLQQVESVRSHRMRLRLRLRTLTLRARNPNSPQLATAYHGPGIRPTRLLGGSLVRLHKWGAPLKGVEEGECEGSDGCGRKHTEGGKQ